MTKKKSKPGIDRAVAVIERGAITIRVSVASLPAVLSGACDLQTVEPRCRVTDAKVFAKELVRALNDEDEQGTTAIHRMFDAAMQKALEQGAEGVEECDEDGLDE